jgi:hypothetical protein
MPVRCIVASEPPSSLLHCDRRSVWSSSDGIIVHAVARSQRPSRDAASEIDTPGGAMKPATSVKPGPVFPTRSLNFFTRLAGGGAHVISAQPTLVTISIQSSDRPQSLAACRGATSISLLAGLRGWSAIALSEVSELSPLPGVRPACG